jgi:transcriptional regulator with XRE-family HTH domain
VTAPLAAALQEATPKTRRRVANEVDVSPTMIERWCRDTSTVAPWVQRRIANALRRPDLAPEPRAPVVGTSRLNEALSAAPSERRMAAAARLGISLPELRRRAKQGWLPTPLQRCQIATILGCDERDLRPEIKRREAA